MTPTNYLVLLLHRITTLIIIAVIAKESIYAENKAYCAETAKRPNIVFILADDLGYGDVQCYNRERGKIPTPTCDRLAAQGLRFTDAHSSSGVCSPSRYSLLTGRYHWRTRLQSGIVNVFGKPLIAEDRLTIAGLLKGQGYRTAAIGKWHLGWDWPIAPGQAHFFHGKQVDTGAAPTAEQQAAWDQVFGAEIPGGPTTRGFERYFGTDVPNWPPYAFIDNNRVVGRPTALLEKRLLGNNQASQQGPALKDWKLEPILPTLADKAGEFIRQCAAKQEPFFLYLPLTAPHTPLAVLSEWQGKSGLNAYADFVMETDAVVGRVLASLDQAGVTENTLLVFTSDNGCAPYVGAAELEKQGHYPSGPLRGYKADVWEGGHRIPFIVRWPGHVKPGTTCGQLVQHADLLATVADVVGAKLPDAAGPDSFSLRPLLAGNDQPIREHAVNCSSQGIFSVRRGNWKLIFGAGGGGFGAGNAGKARAGQQLYDLQADLGEKQNRFTDKPELVAELTKLMEKLAQDGRSTPGTPQANDVPVRWQPKTMETKTTSED